jgi:hypothetical protein
MDKKLEKYRNKKGMWASREGDKFGLFFIPMSMGKAPLKVISSPLGEGEWDHVSVSLPNRCPTWDEMCFIKNLFWGEEETVIQFHPPKSEYVNNHPYCLHLWKNNKLKIETPPNILVGYK